MIALKHLLPLLLAAPLAAQTAGTWHLIAEPNLTEIIEKATQPMNFLIRPIARGRLKKTNGAYQQIQIARTPTEITIRYDQREPQHMPVDGQAVNWKREDGETFLISARTQQDDLVQTYKAEDGERTNLFHFDPRTRTLNLLVTVKSRKLPNPLTYTLSYKGN